MSELAQWEVKIAGEGEHRIQIDLRAPVDVELAQSTFARHSGSRLDEFGAGFLAS